MACSTPSPAESCGKCSSNGSFSDGGNSFTSGSPVFPAAGHHHLGPSSIPPPPPAFVDQAYAALHAPPFPFEAPMPIPYPTRAVVSFDLTPEASRESAKRRYASEDDWRQHRNKITSLYRSKRLKDVMAIMERDHNLHATERMYKARFKDWGLQKNVTAAEVHRLMQKVEQEQQRQRRRIPSGHSGRMVLDIGTDLDLRRIQKYMKRRPKGLDNLRRDPQRPLEKIKALSVDGGGAHGKVSIDTVKLEEQGQDFGMTLPPPILDMVPPCPPVPEVPRDTTGLVQNFNNGSGFVAYDCLPQHQFSTPSLSPQWQPQHQFPTPSLSPQWQPQHQFPTPSLSPQWQPHGYGQNNLLDCTTSPFGAGQQQVPFPMAMGTEPSPAQMEFDLVGMGDFCDNESPEDSEWLPGLNGTHGLFPVGPLSVRGWTAQANRPGGSHGSSIFYST